MTRIELASTAWKAVVLAIRPHLQTPYTGFEPAKHFCPTDFKSAPSATRTYGIYKLREKDSNLRLSGHEPGVLPLDDPAKPPIGLEPITC